MIKFAPDVNKFEQHIVKSTVNRIPKWMLDQSVKHNAWAKGPEQWLHIVKTDVKKHPFCKNIPIKESEVMGVFLKRENVAIVRIDGDLSNATDSIAHEIGHWIDRNLIRGVFVDFSVCSDLHEWSWIKNRHQPTMAKDEYFARKFSDLILGRRVDPDVLEFFEVLKKLF